MEFDVSAAIKGINETSLRVRKHTDSIERIL